MEEFGIKCMEKMHKKLERKKEGDLGDLGTTAKANPAKRVTFENDKAGSTTATGTKHVANMHIDVVPDSMKSKRLTSAIKMCTDKVLESRAVTPWGFTGPKVDLSDLRIQ